MLFSLMDGRYCNSESDSGVWIGYIQIFKILPSHTPRGFPFLLTTTKAILTIPPLTHKTPHSHSSTTKTSNPAMKKKNSHILTQAGEDKSPIPPPPPPPHSSTNPHHKNPSNLQFLFLFSYQTFTHLISLPILPSFLKRISNEGWSWCWCIFPIAISISMIMIWFGLVCRVVGL